jgi:hypothetical protein
VGVAVVGHSGGALDKGLFGRHLAVLAALYGVWSGDIDAATQEMVPREYKDGVQRHGRLRGVLSTKALPLAVYSAVLTAILTPTSVSLLGDFVGGLGAPVGAAYRFDQVRAALITVDAGLLGLSLQLVSCARPSGASSGSSTQGGGRSGEPGSPHGEGGPGRDVSPERGSGDGGSCIPPFELVTAGRPATCCAGRLVILSVEPVRGSVAQGIVGSTTR